MVTVPLVYLAVIGTVNGVNFTDGLDGLATGVTTMVAVFFTAVSIGLGGGIEPITAAVTGALLGFCYLTSIRHRYLWEIPDLWHLEDLWQVQPMC